MGNLVINGISYSGGGGSGDSTVPSMTYQEYKNNISQYTNKLVNITDIEGDAMADAVVYNNSSSDLTSVNVQGAIDELADGKVNTSTYNTKVGEIDQSIGELNRNLNDIVEGTISGIDATIIDSSYIEKRAGVKTLSCLITLNKQAGSYTWTTIANVPIDFAPHKLTHFIFADDHLNVHTGRITTNGDIDFISPQGLASGETVKTCISYF